MTVKSKKPSVKASKLKKNAQIIKKSKAYKIQKAVGAVKITAAGNKNYKKGIKKATVKVVVN